MPRAALEELDAGCPVILDHDAADLRDLLAQSIVEIRAGRLDPKLANSISYLGAGFLRAVELADIEARLMKLEREIPTEEHNGKP